MRHFGKKILISFALLSVFALGAFAAKEINAEYSIDKVEPDSQIYYVPSAGTWSYGATAADRILLKKKVSDGSGSYSEYYYGNNQMAFSFGSVLEFMYHDKLYLYDQYALKFYAVGYNKQNKTFYKKDMDNWLIEEIFRDAKIVKISEFKKNRYRFVKMAFKPMKILLLNDTPEYFYKYYFHGSNFECYDVMGLIEINKMGVIELYHPAPEHKELYIDVVPF